MNIEGIEVSLDLFSLINQYYKYNKTKNIDKIDYMNIVRIIFFTVINKFLTSFTADFINKHIAKKYLLFLDEKYTKKIIKNMIDFGLKIY